MTMLKRCSICGEEKPRDAFSPTGRGYLDSRCRPCNSARVKAAHHRNPVRKILYDRKRYYENRDAEIARHLERAKRNTEAKNAARRERYARGQRVAVIARMKLQRAIRLGRIVRPEVCSKCGGHGRRIEAHHMDYSKPFEVQWLCSVCHGATRRIPLPNIEFVL